MKLSHSRVECFKKCPYQFKLRYIDGFTTLPKGDPQDPLILGHAMHTGIEKTVKDAIDEYYAAYPVIDDSHITEAIKLEYLIPKVKAVIPNGEHEVKLENEKFVGYIDLISQLDLPFSDDIYDLYDFKYSNNVKNYMDSDQLHLYKYYFEKLNRNKIIHKMYFVFIPKCNLRMKRKNKTNPKDETIQEFRKRVQADLDSKEIQLVEIKYDRDKVTEFLENGKNAENCVDYIKQPSRLCDWCEFQRYCEEGDTLDMQLPNNERRSVESISKKVIWLYGAPFSGKTYLANEFPDPLMLNTDGNIKFIDAPYIRIKDVVTTEGRITKRQFAWDVFKEAIAELEKKQNDFKTIVVDLIEDTYEYCRLYMYDKLGIEHESDDLFRAWDKVRTEFLSTIKRLVALDYENIILISHEDTSKDLTKKSGDKVTSIKPNLQDKAALKIAGMVDIVARVIADDDHRVLSFKNSEVIFGGGRLSVKENEIPCDYNELMKVYQEANVGTVQPTKKEEKPMVKEERSSTETVVETAVKQPQAAETPERTPRVRKAREILKDMKANGELPSDTSPIQAEEQPLVEVPTEEKPVRRRRRV